MKFPLILASGFWAFRACNSALVIDAWCGGH